MTFTPVFNYLVEILRAGAQGRDARSGGSLGLTASQSIARS
jgi:hypothetical protein